MGAEEKKKAKKPREYPLSKKAQKFAEIIEDNGTQAAKDAGYKGNNNVLAVTASRLLRNAKVLAIIQKRQEKEKSALVADRTEREERLSEILRNDRAIKVFNQKLLTEEFKTEVETKDVIKAIDTLNKMDGFYVTKLKLEITHEDWVEEIKKDGGLED